jgi:phage I-like protein
MTGNLVPILNRSADGKFSLPDDNWYQIAPCGEFPHAETKTVQVLDSTAHVKMANRFVEESKTPNFAGLRIDYDHFSYDTEKSSEAAGWITGLQNRDNGLFAQINWTPTGKAKVQGGEYRFISPVWMAPRDVQPLGNGRVRPIRLDTAGLTNDPNLKGMVPLSNRNNQAGDPGNNEKDKMKSVASALGLSEDASESAVLAEVTKLKNRAVEVDTTPLKNRITTLETENKNLLTAQVETDLELYKNRYSPESKETIREQLLKNREGTIIVLKSASEKSPAGATRPMHNRENRKTPETKTGGATVKDNRAAQNKLVNEIKIANRCSYDDAWAQAEAQSPELFAAPVEE